MRIDDVKQGDLFEVIGDQGIGSNSVGDIIAYFGEPAYLPDGDRGWGMFINKRVSHKTCATFDSLRPINTKKVKFKNRGKVI